MLVLPSWIEESEVEIDFKKSEGSEDPRFLSYVQLRIWGFYCRMSDNFVEASAVANKLSLVLNV